MGVTRNDGGYSASVEGFIVVNDVRMRLAKTNGVSFVLAEPSEISVAKETRADLEIVIDGDKATKQISLVEGIACGQRTVPYAEPVPF